MFNPSTWGKDVFVLHFLCECESGVHFTDHIGYEIADPKSFLRFTGPLIGNVGRLLVSTGLSVAGSQTPYWFTDLVKMNVVIDSDDNFRSTAYRISKLP
jgi:hypothetical protein